MNILFVCKWNRFRSKAAEAIFKKVNTRKDFKVQSAGVFPGVPVGKAITRAGKNIGIAISEKQQGLSHKLLLWSDYIIIVAQDVPKSLFKEVEKNDGKKVIHWKIKDVWGPKVKQREKTMLEIKKRIESFLKSFAA